MQGERKNYLDHLFVEKEVPNLRSVFVRRCSEKFTHARAFLGPLAAIGRTNQNMEWRRHREFAGPASTIASDSKHASAQALSLAAF